VRAVQAILRLGTGELGQCLRYELAAFNLLISRTFIEVYYKKILSKSQNCRLDLMGGDR
jgi:hypothetical protein